MPTCDGKYFCFKLLIELEFNKVKIVLKVFGIEQIAKSVVMILRCTVPLAVSRIIFLSGKIELSTIELHCFVHTFHEHNEETLAVYLNAMSDIDL
ncbi:unnamed protein product [Rotaria magnacalcarata]|uniref:Uncharacterized protein n=1 Tax=Rotaria magnacalcarata TaxID=392030 RepID=A0A819EJ40_9BILA|nr:unnamed protein product [Rotaria magnacalcarata]CAF3850813.1 unnamed protein product [Rotaria magnacalcarata]